MHTRSFAWILSWSVAALILSTTNKASAAAPYVFGDTIGTWTEVQGFEIDGKDVSIRLPVTRTVSDLPVKVSCPGLGNCYAWTEVVTVRGEPIDLGYVSTESQPTLAMGSELQTTEVTKTLVVDGESCATAIKLKRIVTEEPSLRYFPEASRELWTYKVGALVSGTFDLGEFAFLPDRSKGGGRVAKVLSLALPQAHGPVGFVARGLPSSHPSLDTSQLRVLRVLERKTYTRRLVRSSVTVKAGILREIPFTVDADMGNPRLEGQFYASGGSGNDIIVGVMNQIDYTNWSNGHAAGSVYFSGQVTAGKLSNSLPETGLYFLVLSNKFSSYSDKEVYSNIQLKFEM